MTEVSPLANICETCPVRELIDCNTARVIGRSSIGTQAGVWERFSDGRNAPVTLTYAKGEIDDSDTSETIMDGAHQAQEACEAAVKPGICTPLGSGAISVAKPLRWARGRQIKDAEDALPYVTEDLRKLDIPSGWYVRGGGWPSSYKYPFANTRTFTVTKSLKGAISTLRRGTECRFGTDTDGEKRSYARVSIKNYAEVIFSYVPVKISNGFDFEQEAQRAAERNKLQSQGIHQLLNGWDPEATRQAYAAIDKPYARQRAELDGLHAALRDGSLFRDWPL